MISLRSAGVVFAIVGTMGIAILAWTDSFWISVLGAGLFVGPLLLLTLSIWRVAMANRRATAQRMTSLGNTLNEIKRATRATHASLDEVIRAVRATNRSLDEVVRSGRATNNSMKYVTKAAQTTVNRLNNTAADLRTLRELNRGTSDRVGAFAEAILAEVAQVQLDAVEHDSALTRLEAELKRALLRANRDRDRVVGQLHGIIALYSIFRPERPYPDFGSWAIAGDFAKRYVERVMVDQPQAIIEVGSGLSTLLSARALEEVGADGHVFALEHEMHWLEVTNAGLREHGLEHRATVLHAPLTEVTIDSEIWKWYDLEAIDLPTGVGVVLVDGPPQSTGSLARYPALPALLPYLADDAVIFLDDGIREDETEVAERWAAEIPGLSVVRHKDRKETIEIHRNPG